MAAIRVAGHEFKSQAELRKYYQGIVANCKLGQQVVEGNELFPFLLDFLKRHPRAPVKVGCGVAAFELRRFQARPGLPHTTAFWVVRKDGTVTDFSYLKCLGGREQSREQKLRSALRTAVVDQVSGFKNGVFVVADAVPCAVTGVLLSRDEAHVDHEAPNTFLKLAEDFLRGLGIPLEQVEIGGSSDGETANYLKDSAIKKLWQDFHRAHAKLRIVSRKANLSLLRKTV